jgi:hypothetical protein
MNIPQAKMNTLIAEIKNGRKETTACHEATEANPEKEEPNPEIIQSVGEHQEISKE